MMQLKCIIFSFRYSGNVRHIKIEKNPEGMYFMSDTRYFHSLPVSCFFWSIIYLKYTDTLGV